MNLPHHKIAIVGAGPAGLASALFLSQDGHEVHLFEKQKMPIDKVCGEGITPWGVEILKRRGVELVGHPFEGIHYIDNKNSLQGRFSGEKGLGVRRVELSKQLFALVQKSSTYFYPEAHMSEIKILPHKKVQLNFKGENLEFDYLLACDGRRSALRTSLGLEFDSSSKNKRRFGARVHYQIPPWSSFVQVYWGDHVEAYITPVSDHVIEVAFLWYEKKHNFKSGHYQQELLDLFPKIKEKVQHAPLASRFEVMGGLYYHSKTIQHGPVLFLGDALGFGDGITGEGLSMAFFAADQVAQSFKNDGSLKSFERLMQKSWKDYLVPLHLCLFLSRHPNFRQKLFCFLQRYFPQLFETILNWAMGKHSLDQEARKKEVQAHAE